MIALTLGLASLVLAAVLTLALTGKDVGAIMNVFLLVINGLLITVGVNARKQIDNKLDEVKSLANGRMDEMMRMVRALHNQTTELALKVPPQEQQQ